MVTIRHKQLNEVQTVSISTWNKPNKYNQDLWEVMEIRDVVDLYSCDSGVWRLHNTLELETAKEAVAQHPNTFKYEPSKLNTSKIIHMMPRLNIDSVLIEASRGILLKAEDSSPEHDEYIKTLVTSGLIKEETNFYSILPSGRDAIEIGGYENWVQSKKTRSERVLELLAEVSKRGYTSTSKQTSHIYRQTIEYAVAKHLLEKEGNTYKLTGNGYDVIDIGSLDLWLQGEAKPSSAITYYNNATHIQSSDISGEVNNHIDNHRIESNVGQKENESTSWHYWVGWAIAILGALTAIYWGLVDHSK